MSHQQQRQIRILLLQTGVQHIDVVHRSVPCVAIAEIHRCAALGQRLAVAQMVVAHHDHAVVVEEPGEIIIAAHIFRHAVDDLQDRHRRYVRGDP